MADEPLRGPRAMQARIAAERNGEPYLWFGGPPALSERRFLALAGREQLWIGRDSTCELCLDWDHAMSRVHAELRLRAGSEWNLVDDGSTNGTLVNGSRVIGR